MGLILSHINQKTDTDATQAAGQLEQGDHPEEYLNTQQCLEHFPSDPHSPPEGWYPNKQSGYDIDQKSEHQVCGLQAPRQERDWQSFHLCRHVLIFLLL